MLRHFDKLSASPAIAHPCATAQQPAEAKRRKNRKNKAFCRFKQMKVNRYIIYLLFISIGLMVPLSYANAVNSQKEGREKIERGKVDKPENQKMDVLSLIAHIAMTLGIASLFFIPEVSLILIPAAFIIG